jgi:hypothetical protein
MKMMQQSHQREVDTLLLTLQSETMKIENKANTPPAPLFLSAPVAVGSLNCLVLASRQIVISFGDHNL